MAADAFSVHPATLVTVANGFDRAAETVTTTAGSGGVQAPGALGPVVDAAFGAFSAAWRVAGGECAATATAVGPGLRATGQSYRAADDAAAGSLGAVAGLLPPGR